MFSHRLMQKLLRENDAINVVMKLIALPFQKGMGLAWFSFKDRRLTRILELLVLMYRLMKQMVKNDDRNSWELFGHIGLIKSHLGKGLFSKVT